MTLSLSSTIGFLIGLRFGTGRGYAINWDSANRDAAANNNKDGGTGGSHNKHVSFNSEDIEINPSEDDERAKTVVIRDVITELVDPTPEIIIKGATNAVIVGVGRRRVSRKRTSKPRSISTEGARKYNSTKKNNKNRSSSAKSSKGSKVSKTKKSKLKKQAIDISAKAVKRRAYAREVRERSFCTDIERRMRMTSAIAIKKDVELIKLEYKESARRARLNCRDVSRPIRRQDLV